MVKTILTSFSMAFGSIRSRFFHTLLSVLGIVIGVGALVAILSLIDGMEKYANEQITKTTSLKSIMLETKRYHTVNDVRIKKENPAYINFEDFQQLQNETGLTLNNFYSNRITKKLKLESNEKEIATICYFSNEIIREPEKIKDGRFFNKEELLEKKMVSTVNSNFASLIDSVNYKTVLGKNIIIDDSISFEVIGIREADDNEPPTASFPITHLTTSQLQNIPPRLFLEAEDVNQVPEIKKSIEEWVAKRYGEKSKDIRIQDQGFRLKQANQGFLIFRIIMGMIVGLSVLVGGVGVMNVLLISVSERTSEIGIRKALGASKKTIIAQFMSESIAVSIFGSFVGVLFGMAFAMAAMPILKHFAEVPFSVTFTFQTMLLIAFISVLIGIVFGTYPAIKASRLDPVVAIQRE